MPQLLPFRGLRYRCAAPAADGATGAGGPGDPPPADAVIAPPYDVVDDDERRRLAGRHPNNAVRLILPDPAAPDPYAAAAAELHAWRASGVLVAEARPALYPYRMAFRDGRGRRRSTVGVIGALALPAAPGGDGVLPHERTLPKAKSDRLALLRATRANLDPIWGLSPAPGLADLVAPDGPPAVAATDDDGVEHALWVLDDPARVAAVGALVAGGPVVLADGHHRFETAMTLRDEVLAAGEPVTAAGAGSVMALVTELADEHLDVQPIHRLLTGLPAGVDLRARLRASFQVVPVEAPGGVADAPAVDALVAAMEARAALGLVDGAGAALLVPRPEAQALVDAAEDAAAAGTDAARYEHLVAPLVGGAEVAYRAGAAAVADAGRRPGAAAVLLRPPTVAEIRRAAFAGVRMPQKSTYFSPKPRTGMVFRVFGPSPA